MTLDMKSFASNLVSSNSEMRSLELLVLPNPPLASLEMGSQALDQTSTSRQVPAEQKKVADVTAIESGYSELDRGREIVRETRYRSPEVVCHTDIASNEAYRKRRRKVRYESV